MMVVRRTKPQYYKLEIVASTPATEIWLGDDAGHLVQKGVGALKTSLLPGFYVVEFGLGTSTYPIKLDQVRRYTQTELEAGPTCTRPAVRLLPE